MLTMTSFNIPNSIAFISLLASPAWSFYLPGVAPTSYKQGDTVPLHVNSLKPFDLYADGMKSIVSYDYYKPEFHFCPPDGGAKSVPESLGSILFGDRIFTSPFDIKMLVDEKCKNVCPGGNAVTFSPTDSKFVNERISQSYILDWLVDGLPAAMEVEDPNSPGEKLAVSGFPLGRITTDSSLFILHNHFDLIIDYHRAGTDQYRVVGFTVDPYSYKPNKHENGVTSCGSRDVQNWVELSDKSFTSLTWTYSVTWRESSTVFATRWDKYLHVVDPKIHWLWLINTAVIVILLVGMVSTVLARTLRKDIARYNRLDDIALEDLNGTGITEEGVAEDSGWKLVHGDVFRSPTLPLPLSVLVGNGVQLFLMTGFTFAFALFGFLSPSNRGALGTAIILFSTFFSLASGYTSSRVYKFFGGEGWKRNFIYTPVCLPLSVFAVFFALNLILWARGASGAVPLGTMFVLVSLWFVISLPFSLAGSWLGFKADIVKPPTKTNQIPRQIPTALTNSSLYLRPIPGALMAGILPFIAISVELSFILSSLWSGRIYYMFGFLFLCYGLMVMMCATVTVLMTYFLLCAENYHWQWRAFFSAGATGIWTFLFSLIYWLRFLKLESLTGIVLYLGYSALMATLLSILAGTIGFISSWLFVLRIYGSIKVD